MVKRSGDYKAPRWGYALEFARLGKLSQVGRFSESKTFLGTNQQTNNKLVRQPKISLNVGTHSAAANHWLLSGGS